MDAITQFQDWYFRQCDGEWEHRYGAKIETLDNPGWYVTIDLTGTTLEVRPFAKVEYGLGDEAKTSGNEWLMCEVREAKFIGACGPLKLREILSHFMAWAQESTPGATSA